MMLGKTGQVRGGAQCKNSGREYHRDFAGLPDISAHGAGVLRPNQALKVCFLSPRLKL
jgi:hypothetical protein